MLSKCTYIDSYFLRSVNDDDIFMAYRGGAGNYFSKPHLDDDYYINLCKMAVDTAFRYYDLRNKKMFTKESQKEKLKEWDGRI